MKRLVLVTSLALTLSACATSYRHEATGPTAFSFSLAPELCQKLKEERRTYRAAEQTSAVVSGGTALLGTFLLGFLSEKTAPALASGVTLSAAGVSVFASSQVSSLDEELADGSCSR